MELKEGMYAYSTESRERGIGRIIKIDENRSHLEVTIKTKNGRLTTRKEFTIASNNPINLIKVGDYVNGYKVYSGGKKHFDYIITWDDKCDYFMKIPLHTVDIKSIVTKEQFERESYKVGE